MKIVFGMLFVILSISTNAQSLHDAARDGNIEHIKSLLESGSDPNIQNKYGWAPIHFAAWWANSGHGNAEIVRLLHEASADPNIQSGWRSETPLHIAADKGNLEFVQIFLEAGVDPNVKDNDGRAPLHRAARESHTEIVQVLLEAGGIPREIRERLGNPRSPVLIFQKDLQKDRWLRSKEIVINWFGGRLERANELNGNWQIQDEKQSGSLSMNSDQAAFFRIVANQ